MFNKNEIVKQRNNEHNVFQKANNQHTTTHNSSVNAANIAHLQI